jgi:Rap1a immunity proteins
MRSIALAAIAAAVLATPAWSDPQEAPAMTAGDLQQLCLGTDHVSKNACRIYILGVTQGIEVGLATADGKSPRPCVPGDTSAEALETTLKTKLDADLAATPANRDHDAARFIGSVLAHAFPCGKPHH